MPAIHTMVHTPEQIYILVVVDGILAKKIAGSEKTSCLSLEGAVLTVVVAKLEHRHITIGAMTHREPRSPSQVKFGPSIHKENGSAVTMPLWVPAIELILQIHNGLRC